MRYIGSNGRVVVWVYDLVAEGVDCYCNALRTPGELCPQGYIPMKACKGWQLVMCCNLQELARKVWMKQALTIPVID